MAQQFNRLPQVIEETGLSRSTIYRMIQSGEFPPPIKLTPNGRASGWLQEEIENWKKSRVNRETWGGKKMKNTPPSTPYNKNNTRAAAQRQRLLKALREAGSKGINTFQARHELNIMMPASRIHELRHSQGLNIQTVRTIKHDPEGNPKWNT